MKKIMLVAAALAVIFCFAACNKNKGDVYEPPMTEVISFEDGVTAIFEIVTEENGEVATDEEGETKYIPYVPPVTEKGGVLVTDAAGSTIPSRPNTTANDAAVDSGNVNVDTDIGEIEEPTLSNGETKKPESTAKPDATTKPGTSTTKPAATTKPVSTAKPGQTTAAPENKPTSAQTTKPVENEPVTEKLDGTLSSAKAMKLYEIMDGVENPFDEDLAKADFHAAATSIDTYITNVESAVKAIKEDKALYEFVGNQQLSLWLNNMYEARERYQVFMTMVKQEEGKTDKNPLYYKAYTDFQEAYIQSLEAYYFILFAAEDRI